jgi:hypothetical protein
MKNQNTLGCLLSSLGSTVALMAAGLGAILLPSSAYSAAGDLYVAEYSQNSVVRITPAGAQSVVAPGLDHPLALAVDPNGNIFVALAFAGEIKKITNGVVSTSLPKPVLAPVAPLSRSPRMARRASMPRVSMILPTWPLTRAETYLFPKTATGDSRASSRRPLRPASEQPSPPVSITPRASPSMPPVTCTSQKPEPPKYTNSPQPERKLFLPARSTFPDIWFSILRATFLSRPEAAPTLSPRLPRPVWSPHSNRVLLPKGRPSNHPTAFPSIFPQGCAFRRATTS